MPQKYLVVVDMQEDFVTGVLGSQEARAIVPKVVEKVKGFEGEVIFTRDTHQPNYLSTQEGRNLPVEHCIEGTEGWRLIEPLERFRLEKDCRVYDKPSFGSQKLAADLAAEAERGEVESVELIGVCTDICVVSNALLLKAAMPEIPVLADASCCAGVTPEKHKCALETMRSCQVLVTED